MKECFEEGVLQSYVDDELSPEMAERVTAHVAACSKCAAALSEIANEMAMFSTAFKAEMALDVPTVQLRERIDTAIAEMNPPAQITERKQGWSLTGWLASFGELFKVSPQRAIGFASLIAVIAFAAIFAAIYSRRSANPGNQENEIARTNQPKVIPTPKVLPSPSSSPDVNDSGSGEQRGEQKDKPTNHKAPKKHSKEVLVPQPDQLPQGELANKTLPVEKPLPGETNYLKAIDSLTTEIEASDVASMKPSLRAEYERNLAVVNQAIDSTRRVARTNPKNDDAAQFLYSSYQSKLDLLSTVAEQVRPTVATR
ncbi:MAG TPA: zf-HC2 domain-containing protein [Pyrinomonadaceae bacterium]